MNSLIEPFCQQLELARGGSFSLRAIRLGTIVLIENHRSLTKGARRMLAEKFTGPVFFTNIVKALWNLFVRS